jgi:hypothetical protein
MASIAAQTIMTQRAKFICNATPIAHLPFFFGLDFLRNLVGGGDLGQFKVVQCIIQFINSRAIDRDEAEFFMSEHVEGLALHLDDAGVRPGRHNCFG